MGPLRPASPLLVAALGATLLVAVGAHDLECYENAFYSIDRGTDRHVVGVLGQPVYTLSLGLGVRLPLHGNLGASPAAAVAPVLPAPLIHWLLLTVALASAMLLVRLALEPLGGSVIAWLAVLLLFASAPMVAYTVYNDWPETAVTYCALVGGVFAPHALLQAGRIGHSARRRWAVLGVPAAVFGLFAASHPGYWPQLGGALGLSMALSLACRSFTGRERLLAILGIGVAAALGVVIHVPDLLREATLGAGLPRDTQGPTGELLLTHLFPLSDPGARLPFSLLPLAAVSIVGGLMVAPTWRLLVVACGVSSVGLAVAASTLVPGSVAMAPSTTWTLRDGATVFAVLSAGLAASFLVGRDAHAPESARKPSRQRAGWSLAALLLVAAAQGPLYGATLLWTAPTEGVARWNHDWRTATRRLVERGMPMGAAPPPGRVALWPGGRTAMRVSGRASTDWADAGYQMVTAWTKNRTMAQLVRPNDILFDQTTDLDALVLCDPGAAAFLQLTYLLLPQDERCEGWTHVPDALVDGRWAVASTTSRDDRVRAVRMGDLTSDMRSQPALAPDYALLRALVPQQGTSLRLESGGVSLTVTDAARAEDVALVLPVAYDPAWHASSGRVVQLGGLLAVVGVEAPRVRLSFQPDAALVLRALGSRAAQALGIFGLVALVLAGRRER